MRSTKWYHHLSTEKLKHSPKAPSERGAYEKLLGSTTRSEIGTMYLNHTRQLLQPYLKGTSERSPSFRRLVDSHRQTDATDPRDKIYAFLSLADRRKAPFMTHQDFLKPDYQRSVQEVYTQAAGAILHSNQNLSCSHTFRISH